MRVLGEVRVGADGATIVGHEAVLVATLVQHLRKRVSSEALIAAMWGEEPSPTARASLHRYVARLRRRLPEGSLETVEGGYRLDLADEQVDVLRFERMVGTGLKYLDEGDPSGAALVLTEALELWGEPFGSVADRSEPLRMAADRLEELCALAEEGLARARIHLGRSSSEVVRLAKLVEDAPLREERWELLMLALYRAGRQGEALRAFQRARRVLGEELGIEPGPRLRRMEERILIQDPTLISPMTPNDLPPDPTPFVGREEEVLRISELAGAHRLVTITGPGGVGKSRLALAAARHLTDRYPDGLWLVSLDELPADADPAPAVAAALGVRDRPGVGPVEAIERSLGDHAVLIVLDNCEHLAEGTGALASRLLRRCSGLRIIATSQVPLDVAGEMLWSLTPMELPDLDEPDPASSEAVRLFVDRMHRVVPDVSPGPGDLQLIAEICRRLDGLPLAIELAAARAASFSARQLLDQIDQGLAMMAGPRHGVTRHHRSLDDLVEWSYRLLGEESRTLLRRLAVFAGSFDLEDVHIVCADCAELEESLHELVRRSLVIAEPGETYRYRLLETIRSWLLRRDDADIEHARTAHRSHFANLARSAGRASLTDTDAARILDRAHNNLRAALNSAFEVGDLSTAARMATALVFHWSFRGYLEEGRQWFARLLDRLDELPPAAVPRVLFGAGVIASFETNYPEAIDLLSRARNEFERAGDTQNRAWCRYWLGRTVTARVFTGLAAVTELAGARQDYEIALATFRAHNDLLGLAFGSMFAGWNSLMLGLGDAGALLEEADRCAKELGARQPRGIAMGMGALHDLVAGSPESAIARVQAGIEQLSTWGDRMSMQICTALAACVTLAAGDLESAVAHTSGAVALHRRYGSREWDAFTLAVGVGVICRIAPPEATVVAGYLDRWHPYWREAMRSLGVEPLRVAADVKGDQESAPESITVALDLVEAGLSRLDAGSLTGNTPSGTPLGVHARQRHR